MPAQWTADVVSKMHMHGITAKQLSEEVGFTSAYISMVLNGHRTPDAAEERLNAALDRLIANKGAINAQKAD